MLCQIKVIQFTSSMKMQLTHLVQYKLTLLVAKQYNYLKWKCNKDNTFNSLWDIAILSLSENAIHPLTDNEIPSLTDNAIHILRECNQHFKTMQSTL
jgi:hypothetical protein